MYSRLWWCRKLFCCLAVSVWLWCGYKYQDINKVNNILLCDIKKQNSELKQLLTTCKKRQTRKRWCIVLCPSSFLLHSNLATCTEKFHLIIIFQSCLIFHLSTMLYLEEKKKVTSFSITCANVLEQ